MSVRAPAARPFRTFRELVRLFSRRLGETGFGRFARFASWALALIGCAMIVILRAEEGANAGTAKIAVNAARMSMWLVGIAVAFAASHHRAIADRRDGIEMVALARGFSESRLLMVRAAAAFWLSARCMLVPVVACAAASAASSGSFKVAAKRTLIAVCVSLFAILASAVLGPLGALADSLSSKRGRTLVLVALLLTGLIAEVAHDPALAITGALLTALNGLLHVVGAGKLV